MNKDLSLSQLRHTASFNLILFDLLLSEFRQVSTNSTLPPVSPYTSHSPSSLPHHPSSPLTGTRLSKRRWEAHHPSSFAQTVSFLVLFIFMFFMVFCVSFLCCTKYFFFFFLSYRVFVFSLHLSTSALWVAFGLVFTPPLLSLIFWNFNFWPLFKKMSFLNQREGTYVNIKLVLIILILVCPVKLGLILSLCTYFTYLGYKYMWFWGMQQLSIYFQTYSCLSVCSLVTYFQWCSSFIWTHPSLWDRGKPSAQPPSLMETADLSESCYSSEELRGQW